MTTIHELIDVHAGKLPGLLGTVSHRVEDVLAWLRKVRADVWLRLAAAASMMAGGRAARGGVDRRAPVVSYR
jgi:hypothetical protein